MNIIYITQSKFRIDEKGIYSDLINELIVNGNSVTMVQATNSVKGGKEKIFDNFVRVGIKVGQQYGVNFIKKGIVLLSLKSKIIRGIKRYCKNEQFDLVLYATPPITLAEVIKFCKKKFHCKSYLMLKDIFPQNAIDIGIMSKSGILGIIYKYFRKKEKELYKLSDKIGCMSKGNADYILANNSFLKEDKLEVFPNAICCNDIREQNDSMRNEVLQRYNIDKEKTVFLYGGNLGKPQGLDFLIKAIKACNSNTKALFVIVGEGTEKKKTFLQLSGVENAICIDSLPTNEYQELADGCDVGMIMLDYRFTIPNYPSRILSYMKSGLPIFACTDNVTDIKELVEEDAKCGKWCFSDDIDGFVSTVNWFTENLNNFKAMGQNGKNYLIENFNIQNNVKKIEAIVQNREIEDNLS